MPNKEFLETYPLYRKMTFEYINHAQNMKWPTLDLYCSICKRLTNFTGKASYKVSEPNNPLNIMGSTASVSYICVICKEGKQEYFVKFATEPENVFWKIGQSISWFPKISQPLEDALGNSLEIYKKGMICESQGYGLGALAYYRRVIEDTLEDILKRTAELLKEEEKAHFLEKLNSNEANQRKSSYKIELVKDILPAVLRPGGVDPFGRLYAVTSEGIHSLSDDECMQYAENVRVSLDFIIETIVSERERKDRENDYLERINKLGLRQK